MLKNKTSLVKFDHCIMVSLRTFQPTLVLGYSDDDDDEAGSYAVN